MHEAPHCFFKQSKFIFEFINKILYGIRQLICRGSRVDFARNKQLSDVSTVYQTETTRWALGGRQLGQPGTVLVFWKLQSSFLFCLTFFCTVIMKLSTRLTLFVALMLGSWSAAFAADVIVQVGAANGANVYSPENVRIAPGDVVVFTWVSGIHPTVSDSSPAKWSTFTPSSSAPTTRVANLPVGVYPYHCSAHAFQAGPGLPFQGMVGTITVALASAAADARPQATLNLYPNPSHGQVMVQLTQKAGTAYQLRLSNIIGQSIRTVALKPELTATGLPLDLSDLPSGIYFYSLLVDGKTVATKRLVLQN